MRLSTKSRFAVTAMIDVALREDRGPVSLSAISERHQNFTLLFGANCSANCANTNWLKAHVDLAVVILWPAMPKKSPWPTL
jgi:hypothetical protein